MKTYILFLFFILAAAVAKADNLIIVDKQTLTLHVLSMEGDTIFTAPVCCGKRMGHKQKHGDMRTPEGTFFIVQIHDSEEWCHDFGDGEGMRKGAYGPWFVRLKTPPFSGIGIHGTCFPERQGTRDSEGCVRLLNEDMEKLVKLIEVGDKCTILPDYSFSEGQVF